MITVNVHQAKTQLSQLLRRVECGEEIVIARGNRGPDAARRHEAPARYVRADLARRRARALVGRMLVGQAAVEGLTLATADPLLAALGARVMW